MFRKEIWRQFDFWLFGAVVFLCLFGIVMIRSAIAGSPGLEGYDTRQTQFVAVGIAIIIFMTLVDYHFWSSLTLLMYTVAVLLLLVIFVAGAAHFGAARWLELGTYFIQPAEIGKIVIILALADYFSKTQADKKDLRWILRSFLLVAGVVVWILLQPNLSTSIVIFVIWFSMLWISGLPPKYLAIFAVAGLVVAAAAYPFLEDYQQTRIKDFLFPDPNARHGNIYNVQQALIAIGNGGVFGLGYGHGTQVQLRFLKVRHTDFIFSAMAEEFGFVGTILVVALLVFVILRCLRAARTARDTYGSMIAYGFTTLIFFQTIVNIGVNLKVIPVTGLTLPFISYGGSSLISMVVGIGLIESVLVRRAMPGE